MNVGYMKMMRDIKSLSKKKSFGIVGNEDFFKQEATLALVSAIKLQGSIEEDRYDAHDKRTKTGNVDDALCEYPLIGDCRLITVLNADHLKKLNSLSYWFDEPTEDTKAIFVFTDDIKRPPEELKFDVVAVCNSVGVESKEFMKYVTFCLEGTDTTLADDAVEFSKKVFSNNLHIMKQELIKASFYVGKKPDIALADLQASLAAYPQAKVFDMVDELVKRNIKTSLTILNDLLDQGVNPTFITHLLTQRLRVLQGVLRAYARGERLKDYMIRKKIPLFQYGQILDGTRVLKDFHIKKFFDILCDAEYQLKGKQGNNKFTRSMSETMVVSLCR